MATGKIAPLLVIVGETASGKSDLAVKLAQNLNGEIICADSWTVRREVSIGTAKPTLAEQALVPHHLLDVVGPDEDFTAAEFKKLANQAIKDISSKGKLAIMVGGTGLYIDSVLYDYSFLPAADRKKREELNSLSINELLQKIDEMELDAGSVDVRNKRRLIRLIEANGVMPTKGELRPATIILGLKVDREELNRRIEDRVDRMIQAGLEAEVKLLVDRYSWSCEALKGVGYAQWKGYFEGEESLEQVRQRTIKATLDLAKRQRTWFKRNKSIQWLSTPVNWQGVVEVVTTKLNIYIHN